MTKKNVLRICPLCELLTSNISSTASLTHKGGLHIPSFEDLAWTMRMLTVFLFFKFFKLSNKFEVLEAWRSSARSVGFISKPSGTCKSSRCRVMIAKPDITDGLIISNWNSAFFISWSGWKMLPSMSNRELERSGRQEYVAHVPKSSLTGPLTKNFVVTDVYKFSRTLVNFCVRIRHHEVWSRRYQYRIFPTGLSELLNQARTLTPLYKP